jgi:L-malate glycosyltransferase
MKVLHIAPHYGGGVGSVVLALIKNDTCNEHRAYSLELCQEKKVNSLFVSPYYLREDIKGTDIVLVHYWNKPILAEFFSKPIPDCRLIFWCHKNIPYMPEEVSFPDRWIDTSHIQNHGAYIWSTGGVDRFLEIQPKPHEGFNIGTVCSPKGHPRWFDMCEEIHKRIPESHFTILGEHNENRIYPDCYFFAGKVDDVAPYLAEMDVFGYPLRPDHYGTCEQVLGEAMAAEVVPVVMDNPCERSIVQHGANGFVAITENDYVAHIQHFYTHSIRRQALAYNARDDAKELYSLDTMIAKWNEVFDEMMQKPKKARGVL